MEDKKQEFKCDCRNCGAKTIEDFKEILKNGCPVCGSHKYEVYGNSD